MRVVYMPTSSGSSARISGSTVGFAGGVTMPTRCFISCMVVARVTSTASGNEGTKDGAGLRQFLERVSRRRVVRCAGGGDEARRHRQPFLRQRIRIGLPAGGVRQ